MSEGLRVVLPFGETPELGVPIGLYEDLGVVMRDCVRRALGFDAGFDVDPPTTTAWMSHLRR